MTRPPMPTPMYGRDPRRVGATLTAVGLLVSGALLAGVWLGLVMA